MLKIKFSHNEPNTIPLHDLRPGQVFRTQRGQTAYMVLESPPDVLEVPKGGVPAVSLSSGLIHFFPEKHPVVELDGTLELSRIIIQERR